MLTFKVNNYVFTIQTRSKSCPQCRNKVTDRCMFRIYPTISNETSGEDVTTLQSRLDDAQLQLRQQKATAKEKEDKLSAITTELKKNEFVFYFINLCCTNIFFIQYCLSKSVNIQKKKILSFFRNDDNIANIFDNDVII